MRNLKRYNIFRMHFQTGDAIEFSGHTLLAGAIKWKTGKDVNHTTSVLVAPFPSGSRVQILESLAGGVVPNFLSSRLSVFKGEVYGLRLKPEFDGFRIEIEKVMLKLCADKRVRYDYWSIVKMLFGRVNVDEGRLYCTEFSYIPLRNVGIAPDLKKGCVPGEMCDLGCFEPRVRIL